MFNISEDTKTAAIDKIREVFLANGVESIPSDAILTEAFDEAVKVIMKSFSFGL